MRQFDAKKHFFALIGQTVQIIQKKMIFFQNKIGVLETELQLKIKSIKFRQLKLCASHKGIVAATCQSVNVNVIFLIQKSFRQLQSPQLQNQPSIPGFPPFLAKICTTTYVFLVEKQAIYYICAQLGEWRVSSKMFTDVCRGRGVSRFMCTYALTLSLFMFLSYGVFFLFVEI